MIYISTYFFGGFYYAKIKGPAHYSILPNGKFARGLARALVEWSPEYLDRIFLQIPRDGRMTVIPAEEILSRVGDY